jgi:ribosomal-protein-alanine N-acetyltransferase
METMSSTVSQPLILACRRLTADDGADLGRLFAALRESRDERLFHPHPLSDEAAVAIARGQATTHAAGSSRADEYHVAWRGEKIIAYGMLRGWSEGYAIPSLGIAVHPGHRGQGVARRFMRYLHAVARFRGARELRLKVYRHNHAAAALYRSLGYQLTDHGATEWLGTLSLSTDGGHADPVTSLTRLPAAA